MIYFYFIVLACVVFTIQKIYAKGAKGDIETIEYKQTSSMKKACVICGLFLTMIAGLRGIIVGNDTYTYYIRYVETSQSTLANVLSAEEPIWYVIAYVLNLISADYQWMLVTVGAIYAFSISYFIYKKSEEPFVSYVMLIPMMYFAFTMSGQRQTLAMALACFLYPLAMDKKYLKFFVLIFIASLCHKSAWMLLPLLIIPKTKVKPLARVAYVVSLPAIYVLRGPILSIAQRFLYDSYSVYTEEVATWPTFILYFAIWLVFVFFGNQEQEDMPYFERMLMIGIIVQMFVPLQPNIFRIALYYQIASLMIVPNFLNAKFFKKMRPLAYMIFMAVMLIMYFMFTKNAASANPYYYFWQVKY